jgi:hypothetical protein
MTAKFAIFEQKKSMNPEPNTNRYAGVKCSGDVTLKSSEREIFKHCTVTRADALAVSDASL